MHSYLHRRLSLALFLVLLAPTTLLAQQTSWEDRIPEIKTAINQAMVEGQIPSMTIAIVEGDQVVWADGFGYANLWAQTPAVPSTVYLIGSTFKAMSAMALLQQMEAGKFSLDDSVSDYLSSIEIKFENVNTPITFRHMLTHTSGIPGDFQPYPVWGDKSPPPIESYLSSSLRTESPPLTQMVYSNLAFTLLGYLVEDFAGVDYKQHIKEEIFATLEMKSTRFAPTPEMEERLAIPYLIDPTTNRPVPTERLNAVEWPAGIVYGTVTDQANWLIANLNDGVFKGRHLIDKEIINQMHTRQYDEFKGKMHDMWGSSEAGYGLSWWTDVRDGERIIAHSGSVPGFTAFLQGNKDQKRGVAILSNGNRAHPHLIKLTDEIMAIIDTKEPVTLGGQ